MITIDEWLPKNTELLSQRGIKSARLDCLILLEDILKKPRAHLLAHPKQTLTSAQIKELNSSIKQRLDGQPLAYIRGFCDFFGIKLQVDTGVLIPRPETETMVEWAIRYAPKDSRLIDIGTGSGAIALSIKKHRPDLEVWGVDISTEALGIAQKNASTLGLDVRFVKSDLFANVNGSFATVCANLPYLADSAKNELMPEVGNEPSLALFGGTDGLDLYRKLLGQLPNYLEPNGYLFTECDPWQKESLIAEATKAGLQTSKQSDFIKSSFMVAFRKNQSSV